MSEEMVFIIDDDEAVRDSLSLLLKADGMQVEDFENAQAFLDVFRANRRESGGSSCVLADVRMPGMDGLELQRLLAREYPDVPVLIVTGHGDLPMAVDAMKAGAADFIEKPYAPEEMVARVRDAITAAARTGVAVPPSDKIRAQERIAKLSPRERDVFDLLVVGHTNKEVARKLSISPRTVEVHRAHIMEKTQARGMSQLVRLAIAAGHPLDAGPVPDG